MSDIPRLTPEQIDDIMKSNPIVLAPHLYRNRIHKVEADVRMRNWYESIGFAGLEYEDRLSIAARVHTEARRQLVDYDTPYSMLRSLSPNIIEWFKRKVLRK